MMPVARIRPERRTRVSESEREKHISIHHEDEQVDEPKENEHDEDAPPEDESSDA